MLYFLIHDAERFHRQIAPALALGWRHQSLGPLVELAAELKSTIAAFADRFHLTADEQPFLTRLSADQHFDRRLWRHLVGEVLLYAADDAPAIQTAEETLAALVVAEERDAIRHAHAGSRDLEIDRIPYRLGHAGLNDLDDVTRLAYELARIHPANWTAKDLPNDIDDPAEELAFASESLTALRELYSAARDRGQLVVCEEI
jgi:muconolactone delta-isomerase